MLDTEDAATIYALRVQRDGLEEKLREEHERAERFRLDAIRERWRRQQAEDRERRALARLHCEPDPDS